MTTPHPFRHFVAGLAAPKPSVRKGKEAQASRLHAPALKKLAGGTHASPAPLSPVSSPLNLLFPLLLFLFLGGQLVPSAHAEKFGDFVYDSDGSAITITGYTGAGGAVTIPDTIAELPVRVIYAAFSDKKSLTSVTIPNSVTSIGHSAFTGCTGLTSVTIPNSVTSIASSVFYGCTGLTSVTISNSVTSIEDSTFGICTGLASVTIPDSVTSIGYSAFYSCTSLSSVTIGDGVTSIGRLAFASCSGLTSVTISNSVTSIESYAFSGCTGLSSVVFEGNAPTSFGFPVFYMVVPNFTIYYHQGSTGFTTPEWNDYRTVMLPTPSVPTLEEWRKQHFGEGATNTGTAADNADPDGDGFTNVEEYAAGTNPKGAGSQFQVASATKTATTYTLTFDAQPGRRYELQRLASTPGATWLTVATQEPRTTAGPLSLTDSAAPPDAALYRIKATLP